ncbi:MAG: ABC transporter ATP-binding protein [Oscillospiraceae bacterium]|nr:ABC transporter ATP-binding protein [Oscillospiraceae bacterium]
MLEIKNLHARLSRRSILQGVDLTLTPHTLTAVVGKNGCGKSTLVGCIGQTTPYMGEILFSGRNLALMPPRERASLVSILPQTLHAPHITVRELVTLGRSPYIDIAHHLTANDRAAVDHALEIIGIADLSAAYVDTLSGGERQKAYLAMTLAQDTRLLILDEPTTYMDMAYEQSFLSLLTTLHRRHKKTLLVVMHDLTQAVRHADHIAVMDDGHIVFCGTTKECLAANVLEQTFAVRRHASGERIFFTAD